MCGTNRKFLSVLHDTFLNSDPIMGGELLRVGNIVFRVPLAAQKIDHGDVSMIKVILTFGNESLQSMGCVPHPCTCG